MVSLFISEVSMVIAVEKHRTRKRVGGQIMEDLNARLRSTNCLQQSIGYFESFNRSDLKPQLRLGILVSMLRISRIEAMEGEGQLGNYRGNLSRRD